MDLVCWVEGAGRPGRVILFREGPAATASGPVIAGLGMGNQEVGPKPGAWHSSQVSHAAGRAQAVGLSSAAFSVSLGSWAASAAAGTEPGICAMLVSLAVTSYCVL